MSEIVWLSEDDVRETGVCDIASALPIIEEAFKLYDNDLAIVAQEVPLRLRADESDSAFYSLPAYVGGTFNVCGIKWTAHGAAVPAGNSDSRIKACAVLNDANTGAPLAIMNSTEIGAVRTGAVTALALKYLAPKKVNKVTLCGAGSQAALQLAAVLHTLPDVAEIAVWSRGYTRAAELISRYNAKGGVRLVAERSLDAAVKDSNVIIGATSAPHPYLTPERLHDASLYCHIGFNEICYDSINLFGHIVFDSWEAGKQCSGQSIFRMYRDGLFDESRISGLLGGVITGRLSLPRGTPKAKVMFDAFGLQIFDIALAKHAYAKAIESHLGTPLKW